MLNVELIAVTAAAARETSTMTVQTDSGRRHKDTRANNLDSWLLPSNLPAVL